MAAEAGRRSFASGGRRAPRSVKPSYVRSRRRRSSASSDSPSRSSHTERTRSKRASESVMNEERAESRGVTS